MFISMSATAWRILYRFPLFYISLALSLVACESINNENPPVIADPDRVFNAVQIEGPLHVDPSNPRYFTDGSGRAIYLTGSHTWANFQDIGYSDSPVSFDYSAYLDFLKLHHHNFFRLWTWEQAKWVPSTSAEIWITPLPFIRTGPGIALDGKPKFDLSQFEEAYFNRMRLRAIQAGERGIYVSIMLFNGWSIDDKGSGPGNAWPGHPFNIQNNINGIDGDFNKNNNGEEIHTLLIPAITSLQENYIRKVVDTVNDLDNVLYEVSNESPGTSHDWQYHMIDFIKSYEATKSKQHPVGMTVEFPGGDNSVLFDSPADWISPNSDGGYQGDPPSASGIKVIVVDSDHLWGEGGDRAWVWKSFTRGLNLIYMDCYETQYCERYPPNDPTRLSVIANMGYVLRYAEKANLMAMTPHPELCSSGYCLANPVENGAEYLVYMPSGSTISNFLGNIGIDKPLSIYLPSDSRVIVDLTASPGELSIEWFNPANGISTVGDSVVGGGSQAFTSPFAGDAVLYISSVGAFSPTSEELQILPEPGSTLPQITQTRTPTPIKKPLPCSFGIMLFASIALMLINFHILIRR